MRWISQQRCRSEDTKGWVGSHFDIVDKISPAKRPGDTSSYTHKLNFELDVNIFNWLPDGNWLRNIELEGSLDYVATVELPSPSIQRKQHSLVSINEALADLDGPVKELRAASPQALHHFTQADQVNQLVGASEADPDLGFMARMMALCSLPRTNPGNRSKYVRRNGPYTLVMNAGGLHKLPFGNLPRLLLAWVCTEAVRTQSRVLVLGKSLSEFMRALGMEPVGSGATGARTRLRNQMTRLFNASVRLVYKDRQGEQFIASHIADRGEFWWDPKHPNERMLWDSKIELGEKFFNEIINGVIARFVRRITLRVAFGVER